MLSFVHKKAFFAFCVLLSFFLSAAFSGYGQGNVPAAQLVTTDSILEVKNKELKDVIIAVKNESDIAFDGSVQFTTNGAAKVVTKDKLPVHVAAHSSSFISAKVYINSNSTEGLIPVAISLMNEKDITIQHQEVHLHLPSSKLLIATILQNEIIMPKVGEILKIPVTVSNRGNAAQEATVVVSFPVSLQDKLNKSIKFKLEPFKDTVVVFQRKVTRAMMRLGYLDISMYGIYPDGNFFSVHSVNIQNLKSNKRFSETTDQPSVQGRNYVTAGIQNAFSQNESYFVRGRGDYAIKDGNVAFSLNATKWKQTGIPTLINDTWIGLDYKHVGVKVGSIVESGELSFNGRGAEAHFYLDSLHKQKIYSGYIDKAFNLINTAPGMTSYGRAAWLGFQEDNGKVFNNASLAYDEDKFVRSKSVLMVDNFRWKLSDALFTEFKAGVARSITTLNTDESKNSFTTGWSFGGNLTKIFSISSENLYATAYYPGSRRGTFSLIEKANWRFKSSNAYIGLMHTNIQPKYLSQSSILYQNNNSSTTAEIGYGTNIGGVGISFSPQFYNEKGNWFAVSQVLNGDMKSFRLSNSISYSSQKGKNNFLLKTDIGAYTTGFNNSTRLQFRSNLTYAYSFFRFAGNVQQGDFYLAEAFQDYLGTQNAFRLNLGPSISTTFFNKKLKWDAGITYYKDFYIKSFLYNTALSYNMGSTQIFANAQYNAFSNSRDYHNIQFGLTQFLPQRDISTIENKGKIELFIFYDLNGNGTYDKGDSIAPGYVASIGKNLLISDNQGRIVFRKLPEGNYPIYFPTQKGWYGLDMYVSIGKKEEKSIEVPLKQTGAIHGTITFEKESGSFDYEVNKEISGLAVKAMNSDGKSFETKTDDAGQYNLYLPTGLYSITVDNLATQIEVITTGNNKQPLMVNSGENLNDINFTLRAKKRKIEIKKFGQPK